MKAGRNDPCPCGSGLKFKKCYLDPSAAVGGYEDGVRSRLVRRLQSFAAQRFGDLRFEAIDEFFDGRDPVDVFPPDAKTAVEINFIDWMLHDWSPEDDGRTVIDHFAETERPSDVERTLLERMGRSALGLYEIQSVTPGTGMVLHDLLRGETYDVSERTASQSLVRWDLIAARLILLDGKWVLTGAIYPFGRRDKEFLLEELRLDFEGLRTDGEFSTLDEYLKSEGAIFNLFWMGAFAPPNIPALTTTTGEAMVFSKVRYRMTDADEVKNRLGRSAEFDHVEEDDSFLWFGGKRKKSMPTFLGSVTIGEGFLVLECQSRERLAKGREALEALLGELLSQPMESFEDVQAALRRRAEEKSPPRQKPSALPDAEALEMMKEFKRRHYKKALSQRIPMLEGKTPRQALRSKRGRALVIEWLKELENAEAHQMARGGNGIDLAWMWERLGLEEERG